MVTSKAAIHIESQATPPIIPVVQGDTGRSILFTLADFTIPTGATATYYIQKPSGNAVYNNAVIEGNTITANLTAQSIAEVGDNYGQVRIAKDGEVVTSFDFILLVKEFRGIDATESITEMNIFDKAVQQAETEITTAKDSAIEEIAASAENIAEEFSAANSYLAGEFVLYGGRLYKFTANHSGAWTGADAEQLTVGDALNDAGEQIETNTADISSLKEDYTTILESAYVTDTTSGAIASFPDGADNVPVKNLKVNIEPVQSGSGDPSPDNVRPISGHTQAVVTRTGKNLFDNSGTPTLIDCYDANGVAQIRKGYYEYLPSGTYTISATLLQNSAYIYINVINKDGTYASFKYLCAGTRITNVTITLSEGQYLAVYDSQSDADATPDKFGYLQIQIELGSTATPYEPYNVQTVTIDLGGTIYGGTLDVGTGALTVTHVYGEYTKVDGFGSYAAYAYTPGEVAIEKIMLNIQASYLAQYNGNTNTAQMPDWSATNIGGSAYIFGIRFDSSYTSKADYDSYLADHPLAVVVKLATPITVQLTAQQMTTLLGQNNVWSDAGDVEVEYRADTKLYIEKLTAPTEDDIVADANIVSGQYFMVGNTLYKATANIASGGAITPNVNCTRKSLPEALNEINA